MSELWYLPSWIAAGGDRMGTPASWEAWKNDTSVTFDFLFLSRTSVHVSELLTPA